MSTPLTGPDALKRLRDGGSLKGVDLTGADLGEADLTGADLTGANFENAQGLEHN
jgi:uncharacterized protein YjbI with pentapeptide repeats